MTRSLLVLMLLLAACSAPGVTDGGAGGGSSTGGAGTGGGSAGGGAGTGGGTTGGGGGAVTGGGAGGGAVGSGDAGTPCTSNGDCASGQCLGSFRDAGALCASPCGDQTDCAGLTNFFCDAAKDGGGLCMPRSPAHCLPCDFDSDCGPLGEVCVLAPGDLASTCRIDCSLAGAAACPPDYSCTPVMLNGAQRSLCMPPAPGCDSAAGGFCDRYAQPQPCSDSNDAGTCTGNRTCVNRRYSTCNAPAPTCKPTCNTIDPTGCTESLCPSATQTVTDCGGCGLACPGNASATANVTCAPGGCTFSCKGETYDVDNDATNGCEIADNPTGNHTAPSAANGGTYDCFDSSAVSVAGLVPADTRVHATPSVSGLDSVSGAAPDFVAIHASGGTFCVNDVNLTFTTTGSGTTPCFRFDVATDKGAWSCTVPAAGTCSISQGSGSYSGGTIISVTVTRTCSAAPSKTPYTITGHL
jgi:hypothetical protein